MTASSNPLQWRREGTLTNGSQVGLRAILPQDDEKMLRLFRDSGYAAAFEQQGGTVHVEIVIGASAAC